MSAEADGLRAALAAKFEAILPHLDERQRRLLLGAEARALGHGGIRLVARAAGVREATVSAGAQELNAGEAPLGRARRPGGGRKRVIDADPAVREALLALVEPDARGDPMSPLRWTTRSTRRLAEQLTGHGHRISADTVADLLRAEGFSLQGNAKTLEGRQHPDRGGQFRYVSAQATVHRARGDPVISVDTKKKELVGAYKNAGREWHRTGAPVAVSTYDFPDPSVGKAIPYGVYDPAANTGWVSVGTDHDTAAFAVASIRRWWHGAGRPAYPTARRLLITADAGGSNGYRTRAWKAELAALAAETGLAITVCHFPPGTSKWNQIEHRLFAQITLNWRGRPLTSHQVIVESIAATGTGTGTGLSVRAELDTGAYPIGVVVDDEQMNALPLERHPWHGEWNYTLRPPTQTEAQASARAGAPLSAPAGHTAPRRTARRSSVPTPADQLSPHLAGLAQPALTGLPAAAWAILLATLVPLHAAHRDDALAARRGRPRKIAPGSGRRPRLTLADRLLATVLHQRLGLPPAALAILTGVRPETINQHIRDIRTLLDRTGYTMTPAEHPLIGLDDLYATAKTAGIPIPPSKIKKAS
jgi:Rhodopirellula transposase DDE domain